MFEDATRLYVYWKVFELVVGVICVIGFFSFMVWIGSKDKNQ